MAVERISKIKNHRIFREFIWPDDLLDFKEKNLVYGWNGTGKSTLSNLFRSIEKRTPISEGEVEFIISGKKVDGTAISTVQGIPQVRVFNKDFIADNVFTSHGGVAPIFFLGEENIEKQKQVDELKENLEQTEEEGRNQAAEKRRVEKAFDDFKIQCAKSIKDLLSSSGGNNPYNNYDKRLYQLKCDELLKLSAVEREEKVLDDLAFDAQKKKKELTLLDKLKLLKFSYPDTQTLTVQVIDLLKKTVVSSVIETLKNDSELSVWVKTGLEKYKRDSSSDCLFCGQSMPSGRIQDLEAHFNDKYNVFLAEIKSQSAVVTSGIESLKLCTPPNRLELYDHLKSEFDNKCQNLSNEISGVKKYLENLFAALNDKTQKPFQSIEQSFDVVVTGNESVISNLNTVIIKHNQETDDFHTMISAARTAIEESLVAQSLTEYELKKTDISGVATALKSALDKSEELKVEISKIEKDIEGHRRPADELNSDICSYLGTDELAFEIQGNGYQISRNGTPAKNLSEGEKTAVAFLYFLKSIGDKSFSLKDGIVVIDDPVSSLDSNALFHAFGFMKDRTKDAGQLFILTHSHSFFRQVKNWFNHLQHQTKKDVNVRPGRFYMLTSNVNGGNRSSFITKLDSLLHEYESEYHYLFCLVYEAAHSKESADFQKNYHLPNIARRLLESFLAFRQPSKSGHLWQKLELIDFDVAKKTRILRFFHTYSHAEQISDPEHDPSILIETKPVLNDLLCLIQKEDDRHFDQMKKLVTN